jgi:predicted negative regulator of RcsB-dependent stress response
VEDYMNEQEQWDWLRMKAREYGPWVVAGVALAAAGLWGWKWWQARTEERLVQAAAQYEQVVTAFTRNDIATLSTLADKLAKEHPGTGYAEHSQLAMAGLQVENNQLPAAIERLQKVMAATHDEQLALTVRLRIARVQLEQNKPDDALATLAAATPGAFAARYAEVRGDALLAKGDRAAALKSYREAQGAAQAAGESAAGAAGAASELLNLKINALTRS